MAAPFGSSNTCTTLLSTCEYWTRVLVCLSWAAIPVVVSTVRPFELLMGKLLGICCAALTQLAVWLGTMVAFTLPGVVSAMA